MYVRARPSYHTAARRIPEQLVYQVKCTQRRTQGDASHHHPRNGVLMLVYTIYSHIVPYTHALCIVLSVQVNEHPTQNAHPDTIIVPPSILGSGGAGVRT